MSVCLRVWVCACVCVYTRIDICTYVCVHTYMHAHIYIHVCIHRYLHIEMHARKYICMPIARNRLDCGDEYLRDRVATAQRKRAVSRDIVRSSREVMPERRVWTWAGPNPHLSPLGAFVYQGAQLVCCTPEVRALAEGTVVVSGLLSSAQSPHGGLSRTATPGSASSEMQVETSMPMLGDPHFLGIPGSGPGPLWAGGWVRNLRRG